MIKHKCSAHNREKLLKNLHSHGYYYNSALKAILVSPKPSY